MYLTEKGESDLGLAVLGSTNACLFIYSSVCVAPIYYISITCLSVCFGNRVSLCRSLAFLELGLETRLDSEIREPLPPTCTTAARALTF